MADYIDRSAAIEALDDYVEMCRGTDGYEMIYRAARIANTTISKLPMGYHKLITYILDTEPGTSLRAAGWKCIGKAGGLRWTGNRRPEVDLCPAQMKIKWEVSTECES